MNFTLSSCTTFCNVTECGKYLSQMCISVMKQLSITGWNIHGVFQKSSGAKISKIDDNDFKTHMASDIVFLSETHISYADTLTCEGYKCQKPILVMLTH
jgi:hypothetical protein